MTAKWPVTLIAALGAALAALSTNPTPRMNPAIKQRQSSAYSARPMLEQAFGRLPLHFEANVGQASPRVGFLSRAAGHLLLLGTDEAVLTLRTASARDRRGSEAADRIMGSAALRTRLVGANPKPKVRGEHEMPGKANYFHGNDPRKWQRNVPLYGQVAYHEVYPGIDLVFYGNQRELEYDFVVGPGADPRRIRLRFEGAYSLYLDDEGDLRVALDQSEVVHRAPRIRQRRAEGGEEQVAGRWSVSGLEASFQLAPYDPSRELVIDPVLVYSTYLGAASGDEAATAIAVDGAGAVYVAGDTASPDFPIQNPFQGMLAAGRDAFVTKLAPGGDRVLYSTFLGGHGDDRALGLAIDDTGSAYVTGETGSDDFPTQIPLQTDQPGNDAFVAKLTPAGDQLASSTYLGGSGGESAQSIALDSSKNVYVAGFTESADFPVVRPLQSYAGEIDAFVTKIAASGLAIEFSTFLGGRWGDEAWAIWVDERTAAYVAGDTGSPDFPTKAPVQGFQGADVFVTKLTPAGDDLAYSTFLGGTSGDVARSLTVDGRGAAYVTGFTYSSDFPTRNPVQGAKAGIYDAFVSKLAPGGDTLEYSTYLGGTHEDIGIGIVVDSSGRAHLTGRTESPDFPVSVPYQSYGGAGDAFVTELSSAGDSLVFSSFLGGPLPDVGEAIALDGAGSIYVAGVTHDGFPTLLPYQSYQGNADAFVTKFGPPPPVSLWTLTPCRVVDSRDGAGPLGGPALAAGADRVLPIAGHCGIPLTARAVALNLTAVQATAAGHLRVNPTGGAMPGTSALNYSAGQTRAGNGVFMLGSGGAITVWCNQPSGTVHLVIDVSGYFE